MSRPTVALCTILRNELRNISQMLSSIEGCFDEIHLTDTGSDDGSIELIKYLQTLNPKIHLHHFKWVDDFSAARNYSFSHAKTDYIAWMDLDDVLSDRDAFIHWRDTMMNIGDYWMATYNYATDKQGKVTCAFQRERVVRRNLDLKWVDFVHEGISGQSPHKKQIVSHYATSWTINHRRTEEDALKDKSRNLKLFEGKENISNRMRYYYGKELFENQRPKEAIQHLLTAVSEKELELHDRTMGIQYAALCAIQINEFQQAINLCHQGMQLDPNRAEFHTLSADSYLKMGKFAEAIPYYHAAMNCAFKGGGKIAAPIHAHEDSYGKYPLNQLARIYANMGDLDRAIDYAQDALTICENEESKEIIKNVSEIKRKSEVRLGDVNKVKTTDIVFSCHPRGPYEWDGEIYRSRGIGGSETACVEMAEWLHKITNRKVIVFNNTTKNKEVNGVHYISAIELPLYFEATQPAVNIMWRHNEKVTDSPSYLWCHDLATPGMDRPNYEKLMALSPFHKDFLVSMCGIDASKIWVTSNGIDPKRFSECPSSIRHPFRVIFSSSPDRGLDRAMLVMDKVVEKFPEAELHCFYGFDNLITMGRTDIVSRIQAMIDERPYVKFHGNVSQDKLTQEMAKCGIWLYPTNFLETYCITAVEALCCGVYPVVRAYGALRDTLSEASLSGMASLVDSDCVTEGEISLYAQEVIDAMQEKRWEKVQIEPQSKSWELVAREWAREMKLL